MKIHVVGAGPAGLYSAILLKKTMPQSDIVVTERNGSDDTFGFGIVLSAETLANLRAADEPTHAAIASNFAYWDDIDVQFKGNVIRSTGHGFSGIRRLTLLNILQDRAAELGIEVRYQTEYTSEASADADLVIASDGINSGVRQKFGTHFQPHLDMRSNRFVWLGAKMNLDAFYYSFRENAVGLWNMHAYQYTPGESTIVIETTNEAFLASGLKVDDEQATALYVQNLFADDLKGATVLTNRSAWRQFPTYHCEHWVHSVLNASGKTQQIVLLGDAAHTAHFSIGSGTKLALEDAIALNAAIAENSDLNKAIIQYARDRRDDVSRIQHSANVSLVWFENVRRFWPMHPIQFNVSLLTRSKQITFDNLALRDRPLVATATRWWNTEQAKNLGIELVEVQNTKFLDAPPMFAPFRLRNMTLSNRVVVSPMAQYSALDGMPDDWHLVHYGSRALGGAGLIFTEMTCPSADARITTGCAGLWNKAQAESWKRIVEFVHQRSTAKICMQLGHAGRKGSTQLGWQMMDAPIEKKGANWPLVSASALPYKAGVNAKPKEMTRLQMKQVIREFVRAAKFAQSAGFDMLELHMAHGYLLASFLSPITNQRQDEYGGTLENRLRFPLELFAAVRKVWPADKPMSVRLSAVDWIMGGTTADDSVKMAKAFKAAGCDLIDVSTGQTGPEAKPVYGRMYQASFSEQIRLEANVATMAVGAVTTADQVNTLLLAGRADLVALARPHLANPYFTLHAAAQYQQKGVSWPLQYQSGAAQLFALSAGARKM
jgi:anthraniloyl-CoA monooxygenase